MILRSVACRILLFFLGTFGASSRYNIHDYQEIDYNDYNSDYNDYPDDWELSRILNEQGLDVVKYPLVRRSVPDILNLGKGNKNRHICLYYLYCR